MKPINKSPCNKMNKLKTILFMGLMCLITKQAFAENITLKFGSEVDKNELEKIFTAQTVDQFLHLIESPDLKVIGIPRKTFSQSLITVPEEYWKNTPENIINHFLDVSSMENGEVLMEKYIPPQTNSLNNEQAWILIQQDANLEVCRHEFIHYLIDKERMRIKTKIYSFIKQDFVPNARELALIANDYAPIVAKILIELEADPKNERKKVNLFNASTPLFLDRLISPFLILNEEIDIEYFLFTQAERLHTTLPEKATHMYYLLRSYQKLRNIFIEITRLYTKSIRSIQNIKDPSLVELLTEPDRVSAIQKLDILLKALPKVIEKIEASISASLETFKKLRRGDLNFDGEVNPKDRALLVSALDDTSFQLPTVELLHFDLNEDMKISKEDLAILDHIISDQH